MTEILTQKYEFLVNNILDTIIEIDLKGNLIYISPQCFDMFGYHQSELININGFDFIHPDDLPTVKKTISNAIIKKKPISMEFRTRHKEGHYIYISTKGSLLNFNNKQTILAVGRDITKEKNLTQKLEESENIFNQIKNQTFMGFAILQDFYVKYCNLAFSDTVGYSQEEVINWKKTEFLKIIHPEDRELLFSLAQKVYNGDNEALNSFEFRMVKKCGELIWSEIHTKPILYKGKKADLVFIQDITEKKISEEKLRESEEKYRLISEDADDLISVYDKNHNLEYINEQTHSRLLGYSINELKHLQFKLSITHKDDISKIISANRVCFTKGRVTYQMRLRHKNGYYLWFETKGKAFIGENEEEKILFISRDITERKKAEDELKAKELKYRTLIENLPQRIFLKDKNSTYISCNNKYAEDLNIRAEDITGKTDYDFYPKELAEKYQLDDKRILARGKAEEIDEIDILKGEDRYIRTIKTPIRDENNMITGLLGIFWDITTRKKVEQELKESEERFKIIYEYAPDAYYLIDYNARFLDGNKAAEELIGYRRDELIGKNFNRVLPENQLQKALNIFKKNQKGLSTGPDELSIIHKKGEEIPVEIRTHPIKISNQLLVLGIARDISQRKRAEQRLKESEEKYRLITENANDLIAILNEKFQHEFINEQVYINILGYSNEDMLGKNKWDIIHPEDFTEAIKKLKEGFNTGEGIIELRLRHKKGHYLWFEFKGKKYLDTEGNIKGLLTARDITQRKIVDIKLRESENKYRNIIENAKEGYYEVDLKGNFTFFNDAFCKLFEYPPEELMGMNFKECTTENMSKKAFTAFNTVFKTGIEQKTFDYEVITKSGKIIYGITSIHLRYDSEGKKVGFSGFLRDITEKKVAEMELKESEEKFRHLFENSPFSIILFDSKGEIVECNSETEKIFGNSKQEIINKNFVEFSEIPKSQILGIEERFRSIKKGDALDPADYQVYSKNGKKIWINSRLSTIKIGEQIFFCSIIEDITEKNILENLMFELNQNFFHFTIDVNKNIQLLLHTANNLSKGDLVLYARQYSNKESNKVQILTNEEKTYDFGLEYFKKNYFMNKIFEQAHEIPQFFSEINENNQFSRDSFVKKKNVNGAYGKIINSQEEFKSAICILYQQIPDISYEDQLVLLLISDAIAIEEQRWQLLQKLEEQNKKLSEIDKLKSEFLRRISHELKTPLIAIKGYSELILQENKKHFDIDSISMIEEIKHGCLRLENLISELMKSSKLESGQIELRPTIEDLSFLIKFTVKELQGLAKTRNQNIITDIHKNLITKFEKERIHEVIGNLLTNAIKYTPPYGIIEINTEIKDKYYIVSVKDNGIGFIENEKENLFKQFGKIEHYGRGSYISTEGTGLGLYICKKLIELHGGEIWMESEGRYKGSTFFFSLPIIKE